MRKLYGYNKENLVDEKEAEVVKFIYKKYMGGDSLSKIQVKLFENGIKSSSGKDKWGRAAIDHLLANSKYVPHIIDLEQFMRVQYEKDSRTKNYRC